MAKTEYEKGRELGLFLIRRPELAHYLLSEHQKEVAMQQASEAGNSLAQVLGEDPTGETMPTQQAPVQQSQQVQPGQFGQFHNEIMNAAQATGLSPEEVYAIQQKESGNRPDAATVQSPTGPVGAMQLSSAAAQDMGLDPAERTDPAKNILAGAQYYSMLKQRYGKNAHAAYYDGPGKADTGEFSPEGLKYQESFADQPVTMQSIKSMPEYYNGSLYRRNGMTGGSGLLGQDMDPVRREHYHAIKTMLSSSNPTIASLGMELYKEMQASQLKDIERPAMQKELDLAGYDPRSAEYRNLAIQRMIKPTQQTNINMGGARPQVLTPEEEMLYIGKTHKEGEPAPRWNKEGDIKVGAPASGTEDEGKSAQFATALSTAIDNIHKLSSEKDFSIQNNQKDFAGSMLESSGIPVLHQVGNAMMSSKQQQYNQAKREAETAIVHAMSGSGFTAQEDFIKTAAYLPDWGDDEDNVVAKQKSLAAQLSSLVSRAGVRATPELREAAFNAKERAKALTTNKDKLPPLPELPVGHKWETP